MNNWPFILGLLVAAVLVVIPLCMIVWLVFRIVATGREIRRAEARRVTCELPGLGEFSTTDDERWFGDVEEVDVMIASKGQRPTEAQVARARALLDDLPRRIEQAREYLASQEDMSLLEGGSELFRPYGLELWSEDVFVIELVHPADFGISRVEFEGGEPVGTGYDD